MYAPAARAFTCVSQAARRDVASYASLAELTALFQVSVMQMTSSLAGSVCWQGHDTRGRAAKGGWVLVRRAAAAEPCVAAGSAARASRASSAARSVVAVPPLQLVAGRTVEWR